MSNSRSRIELLRNSCDETLSDLIRRTALPLLVFVVVEGFPEADPDVEQSQTAAQAAEEAGRDQGTKPGKREQKEVVGPLRGPGQDHKQHAGNRTDQNKKEDRRAVQPELQAVVGASEGNGFRVENPVDGFARCGRGLAGPGWAGSDRQLGVSHRALRCSGAGMRR